MRPLTRASKQRKMCKTERISVNSQPISTVFSFANRATSAERRSGKHHQQEQTLPGTGSAGRRKRAASSALADGDKRSGGLRSERQNDGRAEVQLANAGGRCARQRPKRVGEVGHSAVVVERPKLVVREATFIGLRSLIAAILFYNRYASRRLVKVAYDPCSYPQVARRRGHDNFAVS